MEIGLTFDLLSEYREMTFLSRTVSIPSLKIFWQSVLELSIAQRPTFPLTYAKQNAPPSLKGA